MNKRIILSSGKWGDFMWNEEELLKLLENYFKNVSKEQFLKDLEEMNCLHLVEDING